MDDEFQSLSKGVFVIPFQPPSDENGAGPSKPRSRPLDELYARTLQRYEEAHTIYETERTGEQLDDIADWLERCSSPPLLKKQYSIHRLPVAILQNASASLSSLLPTLGPTTFTLHGREAADLASAVRAIAIGYIGESTLTGKKTGRAGLDEVELWWKGRKDKSPLLLHVQDAQVVPASVLAELIYILALHSDLPIRLLLSVPSTTVFLSSWTHLEPSSIDLCILQSGKTRRRAGGVQAILRGTSGAPLKVSEELAEEIRDVEDLLGGGSMAAMKALKWLLLHHSINSPLAKLAESAQTPDQLQRVQALVDAMTENPVDPSVPGKDLFTLNYHPDLASVLNPASRTSILHALSNSSSYIKPKAAVESSGDSTLATPRKASRFTSKRDTTAADEDGPRQAKRVKVDNVQMVGAEGDEQSQHDGEDLKELETLYGIWKAAGRSVNLWDWLEGFRGTMGQDEETAGEKVKEGNENGDIEMNEDGVVVRITETEDNPQDATEAQGEGDESTFKPKEHDEENEARLHAIFIRFVEEARMMGLVRARGKGRRADEVVKGVGLV
ncbi:hypothetical protein CI109_101643 [Kwoniella shandongensis]|uniref:Uncharacterized protein n=1 Tax=Kwoniella shandongensis TaxID=1734106 RepID=A0A5M6CBG6_9TREE|nr:uncharacterized protein CI109_001232 [Kwoniella shandongensis]KAA5530429.1 hypothetical protein CI109_001232 [Kwoniella shandongensis]